MVNLSGRVLFLGSSGITQNENKEICTKEEEKLSFDTDQQITQKSKKPLTRIMTDFNHIKQIYSSNKFLNFFIETEKPYYNSGSSIEGTVIVQAKKSFQFDALYIRIEGIHLSTHHLGNQQCQWFEGSSKNRRKYTGSQNFYIVEHIISKFDSLLQAGDYAYPFSLELSDNIPGSYSSFRHNAKIQYKMIAYFINYKQPKKTHLFEMPLQIKEPFRQEIVKYNGQTISAPKKFGFFQQGKVKLEVNFDRNVAYQNEQILIQVLIDNSRGTFDIAKYKVELVEYTFVSSNGNASRTYRQTIDKKVLNGKTSKGQARSFETSYRIPTVKHQTAISTLVANYYRLEVSIQAGFGSSKSPSIYAPLFILQLADVKENPQKQTNLDKYHVARPVCIRSGEYLFKKNKNLDVCNFKKDDLVTVHSMIGSDYNMAG